MACFKVAINLLKCRLLRLNKIKNMEQKSKRDLLVSKHTAFVGDDTGLIKKVKIIAKRTQETLTVRYDLEER